MLKNIIINLPSNIGDSMLTLSALDKLRLNYPEANLTLICSKQTQDFFSHHPYINEIMLFDKRWPARKKFEFSVALRGKYDFMVDFKNSLLPLFAGCKHTPILRRFPKNMHAKDKYLYLIKGLAKSGTTTTQFKITQEEEEKWKSMQLGQSLFIACASNAIQKRYPYDLLKTLILGLKERFHVVILGQEKDKEFYKDILSINGITDLVGKTKIHELFFLLKNYGKLLVCVDSSIMHIASYLDVPIAAMFGQTSPAKYGPWSKKNIIIRREDLECSPCENPHCRFNCDCMEIPPERILDAVNTLIK